MILGWFFGCNHKSPFKSVVWDFPSPVLWMRMKAWHLSLSSDLWSGKQQWQPASQSGSLLSLRLEAGNGGRANPLRLGMPDTSCALLPTHLSISLCGDRHHLLPPMSSPAVGHHLWRSPSKPTQANIPIASCCLFLVLEGSSVLLLTHHWRGRVQWLPCFGLRKLGSPWRATCRCSPLLVRSSRCFITELRVGGCSLPALYLGAPRATGSLTVYVVGNHVETAAGLPGFKSYPHLNSYVKFYKLLKIPAPHL